MAAISGKSAIVGVNEYPKRRDPTVTALQIHALCAKAALEEAGLTKDDVDGYFTSGVGGMPTVAMCEFLGLRPTYVDSTSIGGSSFVSHVGHAAGAIASGLCNVALITYGSTSWSQLTAIGTGGRAQGDYWDQFEVPYGPTTVGSYALAAQRYEHEFGGTVEKRAEVSVATRKWAQLNPDAMFREPLTIEDVVKSRVISSPLRFFECCVISDGGGAVVMTSAERARDLKQKPVYILGVGEAVSHTSMNQMADLLTIPAKVSGEKAFRLAGLKPADIQVAEIYDSYTITVLLSLEGLGFCKRGEAADFVKGQRTAPGGAFPLNTDGGGLSSNHPGMRGIFTVIEATRQLRGQRGKAQVKDAKVALCHGTGGSLSSGATAILSIESR
ncbi:MAG: thiolase [Dehalococcoidia bacterium]|nr:thiolase [Dehalococcoidia bacterium]